MVSSTEVPVKMIDLRPNHDLLDVNFGGYKLSLESIPVYERNLTCGPDHVLPSDDQYSFLHLKVFSLHNHLYGDPWSPEEVYFIDRKWRLKRSVANAQTGCLEGVVDVWELPPSHPRQPGNYNPSLSFPAPNIALVADGTGFLHVVQTDSRPTAKLWKAVFSGEVCGEGQEFLIVDSRVHVDPETQSSELHCLLLWVTEAPHSDDSKLKAGNFQSTLVWLVLKQGEAGQWAVARSQKLAGRGGVQYAALEPGCAALYVASEHLFKFAHDSQEATHQVPSEAGAQAAESAKAEPKRYLWQQTADDVELQLCLPEGVLREEVCVEVQEQGLSVACRGRPLLSGQLWARTDASLACWVLERGRLCLSLTKAEPGLMWQQLLAGDHSGEEVLDPALVEEVHRRLAHLCSDSEVTDPGPPPSFNSQQLEDCDAGGTAGCLVRLDQVLGAASHQASLGGHVALFASRLQPLEAPALCLRHDVDGCVWQPLAPVGGDPAWPLVHTGTFHAFGYVQASKQQRKFSVCAPDLSYVAVCDATRHIYVYRQPAPVEGELRNRRTGRKVAQTAQQQLVTLDTPAEVLGAHAGRHVLFVLTDAALLALHINP